MRRKLEVVVPSNQRSRTPGKSAILETGAAAIQQFIELWDEVVQSQVLEQAKGGQVFGGKKCLAT